MITRLIPTPKMIKKEPGNVILSPAVRYSCEEWDVYADTLSASFEKIFEQPLAKEEGGICLLRDPALPEKSYRLDTREGIVLSASDSEGILYAIATLLQIVSVEKGMISVEKALIEDHPDKGYRAVMIDLAREWHPASTIHKYIDLCFILKIKYLHLHFIDDQRYTLPSRAFPHITDGNRFYSYGELAAMRAYANARGIVIVPEFEAPGHAASLNRAYPAVFANDMEGEGASIVTEEGVVVTAENLICAGKRETMNGIRTLLAEIAELFPETPYIHIGGDEANIRAWNHCSHCKRYMRENGIGDVYEMYSDFVGRVAQIVLNLGKTPIVWEGFPKKGVERIPKETVVIAWESHYHMPYDLLAAGFRIINSSWQPLYVVPSVSARWDYSHILDWNVYNWQHWWEKSEATLNPIQLVPNENILGAQLSVWESTFEQEISHVMENLAALSERTWTVRRVAGTAEFGSRLRPALTRIGRLIQDK
ncbi:MAG: family 20 glycosylhydrolase [Clostridia bacterium]|nr:family 20 glycosylhydrolase [Clostridia bacterium]